jgi:apolipoprotein D and lipocalin family protein
MNRIFLKMDMFFSLHVKRFLALFGFIFFTDCATQQAPLKTVEHVDVQKYMGTWYEIARYEQFFEKGCRDINATYSLQSDGKIKVLNQCIKEGGKLSQAIGSAYALDKSNSKLKVTFFWPFYGNYWIVMLGDRYEYAVIGEPSREYFWILSRTKELDASTREMILSKMNSLGYDQRQLIWDKKL